jgi:DNA-binding IclR family transcriptional regulator
MKSILTAAIALFLAGTAGAADYVLYKDGSGRIVLSNIAPPESAQIVARRDLTDATAEEIAATEKYNQEIARLNLLRDLAYSYERYVQANLNAYAPRPICLELNQVAVGVGQR